MDENELNVVYELPELRQLVAAIRRMDLTEIMQHFPVLYAGLHRCFSFCRYITTQYKNIMLEAREYFNEVKADIKTLLAEASRILDRVGEVYQNNKSQYRDGCVDNQVKQEVEYLMRDFTLGIRHMTTKMEILKDLLMLKRRNANKLALVIGAGGAVFGGQCTISLRLSDVGWRAALLGGSIASMPLIIAGLLYRHAANEVIDTLLNEYKQLENDQQLNAEKKQLLEDFINGLTRIVVEGNMRVVGEMFNN